MSVFRGKTLCIEIFGASHSEMLGINVLGFPAGEAVGLSELKSFMARRAPGYGKLSTARKETDDPVFLSGITDGFTDGRPIKAVIRNTDVRRQDYVNLNGIPRPGHADYTAWLKYGRDFDMSGGGPFSGRMTAALCILGGICKQSLSRRGVSVDAGIVSVGGKSSGFEAEIDRAAAEGDSVGGIIECTVTGFPAGLGGDLFDGLEGLISELVFSVPAVKGIEFGAGFSSAAMRGSESNDAFIIRDGRVATDGNAHGGILGGISSGMPIVFRTAIKPTPSIALTQDSVDLDTMSPVKLNISGRHDPCIVPRAVPVIEAAASIALCDLLFAERELKELSDIRSALDRTDAELIKLFSERMALSEKAAEYKAKKALPTLDARREAEKLNSIRALSPEGMEEYAAGLFTEIFRLSRAYQDKLREKK